MTRRNLVKTAAAASASLALNAAARTKPMILELRKISLRNSSDNMRQRMTEFLEKTAMPAMARISSGPVGCFASSVAPDTPFLMTVSSYPTLAAYEEAAGKLMQDKQYMAGAMAFNQQPGLSYGRYEISLLRGFPSMPGIEAPPIEQGKAPRVFELRTYESNNNLTLRKKIGMFEDGEISIFRKTGLLPVFFGETIVGTHMPNLTYMLAYDDLAAREKNWKAFINHPEWAKLRATPGLSDAEIVSNISNIFLSPLPFSQIR